MAKQTRTLEINASPQKCFDTICDFESYPEWQKSIKQAQILDREDGRPLIVEYHLDAILKTISYSLRYSYQDQDPTNMVLEWTYVGGDLKNIAGIYTFKELAPEKTHATFSLDIDIGKWVPKPILKTFKEITMKESIESLKKRTEGK